MNRSLYRAALLLALAALLLVITGAAALSLDRPGPNGQPMPPAGAAILWQQIHWITAAVVGLLTIGFAIWLQRAEIGSGIRRLSWYAVAILAIGAFLGEPRVLAALPELASIAHALLAQLFFAATAALALCTSPSWERGPELVKDSGWPSLRSLAVITPSLVVLQALLGAAFRHNATGVMPHILGAMVVLLLILVFGMFVMQQFPQHAALRPAAVALMVITFVQLTLGVTVITMEALTNETTGAVVIATVAHVAIGALTVAASVVLAIQVRRNVQPATDDTPAQQPA
jgi:heme A synthase